jgi:hypothetical protein
MRYVNRTVDISAVAPGVVKLADIWSCWGDDADDISMDGSFIERQSVLQWSAIRIVNDCRHRSSFTVELLVLLLVVGIVGGNFCRKSDSESSIDKIAKERPPPHHHQYTPTLSKKMHLPFRINV